MTAPIASGWSESPGGVAPTGKRRLFTAHADCSRSRDHDRTTGVDPNRTFDLPWSLAKRFAEAKPAKIYNTIGPSWLEAGSLQACRGGHPSTVQRLGNRARRVMLF